MIYYITEQNTQTQQTKQIMEYSKENYIEDIQKISNCLNSVNNKTQLETCGQLIYNFQIKWGWKMTGNEISEMEYTSDVNSLINLYNHIYKINTNNECKC